MKASSVFSSRYLRIVLNLSPQLDLSDMKNMIFYGGGGGCHENCTGNKMWERQS